MQITHRHQYIVVIALLGFVAAVDGGILGGVLTATPAVHDAAIVVSMGLGVVCAVLPSWFSDSAPLPPPPKPPNN